MLCELQQVVMFDGRRGFVGYDFPWASFDDEAPVGEYKVEVGIGYVVAVSEFSEVRILITSAAVEFFELFCEVEDCDGESKFFSCSCF